MKFDKYSQNKRIDTSNHVYFVMSNVFCNQVWIIDDINKHDITKLNETKYTSESPVNIVVFLLQLTRTINETWGPFC